METRKRIFVSLILFTILLSNCFYAFAKDSSDKIIIMIDGEKYQRDYPTTLEESIELINTLSELEVTADNKVVEMETSTNKEIQKYEKEIAELKSKIESIEKESESAKSNAETVDKTITDFTITNTRLTTDLVIGPMFGFSENAVGSHIEVLADYRIFRNFHIGGSVFFNTFNNTQRNFEIGCGLLLGYSIY